MVWATKLRKLPGLVSPSPTFPPHPRAILCFFEKVKLHTITACFRCPNRQLLPCSKPLHSIGSHQKSSFPFSLFSQNPAKAGFTLFRFYLVIPRGCKEIHCMIFLVLAVITSINQRYPSDSLVLLYIVAE